MLDAFRVSRRITASASFHPDDITAMIAATEEKNRPRRMFNVPNHLVKLMRGKLFAWACIILSVSVASSYTNRVVITILKTASTLT